MGERREAKIPVTGENFPQMVELAKSFAAQFLELDYFDLVVKSNTTPRVEEYHPFTDPPKPKLWSMTVTVGEASEDDADAFIEDDE